MSINLSQIAKLLSGKLIGDPECIITGVGPIDQAVEGQISFAEKRSLKRLTQSEASAVIVPEGFTDSPLNLIQVDNPRVAFAKMLNHFNPATGPNPGIHPKAVVGADCTIGKEVALAAGAVIGDHVTIGDRVVLYPNVVVGDNVTIGEDTIVYPNASILERCVIGCRVIIHAGSVIGSDGFGFVFDQGRHRKMSQIGIVQIDDDVEIGANATIDRGTIGKTWIKTGVKIDNLVHMAHNVIIGEHSIITAQVGIAGSTTIGRHAILAGQSGIGGHLTLGDQVTVGPQGAVAQSVGDKQIVSGTTLAMPHRTWLRLQKVLPGLPALTKKITKLEKQLAQLLKDDQRTP
jgi:UDP-3-O-[3-hydroxymyristoyl] glucosamine N-acyltransferase